ncbi:MAG TPA: HAD family hydrolase [Candidatus Tumulicola sp.]|jgi:putative hydrolase of the HAD superfamily
MRGIDVVLFDLDDTLHDDTFAYRSAAQEVAEEIAATTGVDAAALKTAYVRVAEDFWTRLTAEGLSVNLGEVRRQLWTDALASVGSTEPRMADAAARRYNDCRKKYFVPFPGALDLLRALRARGRRLGLVTNGFSETHREKIVLLQLGELFDEIFIADEVGMLKPDPALFVHACARLGAAPEAAAMVGDRYERDIRGAGEAGLFTVWLNVRGEALPPGAAPLPDATCATLADVGRVLESLR